MKSADNDRGAAAVEFALVLPVLLGVLLGIMEFGFLFNQQISASNAAREGARYAAVHYQDPGFLPSARGAGLGAAPSLPVGTSIVISVSDGDCASGGTVTAVVQPPRGWLTGFFNIGSPLGAVTAPQITGEAAMLCGG
ncbi:TadE/TadG family type IV pilus assembly protein [Arthrobacter sp. Sr24]